MMLKQILNDYFLWIIRISMISFTELRQQRLGFVCVRVCVCSKGSSPRFGNPKYLPVWNNTREHFPGHQPGRLYRLDKQPWDYCVTEAPPSTKDGNRIHWSCFDIKPLINTWTAAKPSAPPSQSQRIRRWAGVRFSRAHARTHAHPPSQASSS